jgi:hypothetical protein
MSRKLKHIYGSGKSGTLKERQKEAKKKFISRYKMKHGHEPAFWDYPVF